jgi:hypothetical protein
MTLLPGIADGIDKTYRSHSCLELFPSGDGKSKSTETEHRPQSPQRARSVFTDLLS